MKRAGEAGRSGQFTRRVASAIRGLPPSRYILAVSGGRDSMVLLDAFARYRSDTVAVATYDHGTGPAARKAALLVELEATHCCSPFTEAAGFRGKG